MIIDFSVKNFRSIKNLQTLSLVAAPIKSKYTELDNNNLIPVSDKLSLLKTAAIYGANGSGKSNVVMALLSMLMFIRDSFKDDKLGEILTSPFGLDENSIDEPTYLQLTFILEEKKYRYGFELFENNIVSEWLFGTADKKEVYYFTREESEIKINENQFLEAKGLEDKTSETNLFINVVKAFNGKLSKNIIDFLFSNIFISTGINDSALRKNTLDLLGNENIKQRILSLLNLADFGINDIKHIKLNKNNMPQNATKEILDRLGKETFESTFALRKVLNDKGKHISDRPFDLEFMESEGTKKLFDHSGIIIRALTEGITLFLDEFDARLHPMLTKKLVEMFNSPTLNKNKAQLVFVTHDTNLLDNALLRRDQIYFTEKNSKSETELYSLADFKGIRNDASYEKDYIKGKYGAIPFLGDFEKLLD